MRLYFAISVFFLLTSCNDKALNPLITHHFDHSPKKYSTLKKNKLISLGQIVQTKFSNTQILAWRPVLQSIQNIFLCKITGSDLGIIFVILKPETNSKELRLYL